MYEREVGRLANYENENKISDLNEIQKNVLESINSYNLARVTSLTNNKPVRRM